MRPKDKGCAYGEAYGCFTGGGTAEDNGKKIKVPPVITPGIPGAPGKPTDYIGTDEILELVNKAYTAAKEAAKKMCKTCCCLEINIHVDQRWYPGEMDDPKHPENKVLAGNLSALHEIVKCGN